MMTYFQGLPLFLVVVYGVFGFGECGFPITESRFAFDDICIFLG